MEGRSAEPSQTASFTEKGKQSRVLRFGPIKITEKQFAIMTIVCDSLRLRGAPPTIHEIAEQYGCSRSGAYLHLRALARKGLLRREGGDRSIIPLARVKRENGAVIVVWNSVDKPTQAA